MSNKELTLDRIKHLFTLRNKTVHYTPDNALNLQVKLEELFYIWKDVGKVTDMFQSNEGFNEVSFSTLIDMHIAEIEKRWLNKDNNQFRKKLEDKYGA